eukprot:TRINITY_DN4180_c7_g1_i1.p1 TRINITY_DN4180_c7_g1~~TRINITY_DN4180_c7_g1_i1.p1  ORF type:complete len:391 (+),score=112.25 TRINITY_DN4180_c7_g1_i1:46-1173(+)
MTYFATRPPSPHWDVYKRAYGTSLTSPAVGMSEYELEHRRAERWDRGLTTPETRGTPGACEGSSVKMSSWRGDEVNTSITRPSSPTWADRYIGERTQVKRDEGPSVVVPNVGRNYIRQGVTTPVKPRPSSTVERSLYYSGGYDETPVKESPREAQLTLLSPQHPSDYGKYTVVLDLDETLVYARSGPVLVRSGSRELINGMGNKFEAVLWTAGERAYAMNALRQVDPHCYIRQQVCRDARWFKGENAGCVKDLRWLGRDLSKCLIIENTPDCVENNPDNAIVVPDYTGDPDRSPILPLILHILNDLHRSTLSIPHFLASSPHLQKRHLPTSMGTHVFTYTLSSATYLPPPPLRPLPSSPVFRSVPPRYTGYAPRY